MQAKIGREKEFEDALQDLRGKDANISKEAADIQVLNLSSIILTNCNNESEHYRENV